MVKGGVNPAQLAQASTALAAIYSNVGTGAGHRRKLPAADRADRLAASQRPAQGPPGNRRGFRAAVAARPPGSQ